MPRPSLNLTDEEKLERKRIASRKYAKKIRENRSKEEREKILKYNKEYYQQNREKELERARNYSKTPQGIKSSFISSWKQKGIICVDYDLMYEKYINTGNCEYCDKEFKNSLDRHLDHDHSITDKPNVRGILCRSCNVFDILKST